MNSKNILLVLSSLLIISCSEKSGKLHDTLVQKQLQMAVTMLKTNLDGLQDVGYQSLTAEEAADQLIQLQTTAAKPDADDDNKSPPTSNGKIKFTYVRDKVTSPYQIVLVADEENSLINIKGYGTDTTKPLHTDQLSVPEY
ncbi:MAG: hypothetical protein HQM16_15155 [Deltaproteobacteria bacterium]|nr:hypothetical protein [Deltaproteobacteria bacterium]